MCQEAGIFSAWSVLYSVPRVTSLATMTSTGRTTRTPFFSAVARIRRASSTRSGSARLLPMALPCASRNVFAIPPPRISRSTLVSRLSMTLILSETLAPPRIAANGRSGDFDERGQHLELALHQQARIARDELRDADRRGVGAVRGPERVVDVHVGVGGERGRELGVVLLLGRVEAQVLEEQQLARPEPVDRVFRADPEGIPGDRHVPAEQLGQALPHRTEPEAVGDLAVRAGRGGWRGPGWRPG